eukprot:scaffold127591_cov63-Phaeocystis_antarctica.AAC.7
MRSERLVWSDVWVRPCCSLPTRSSPSRSIVTMPSRTAAAATGPRKPSITANWRLQSRSAMVASSKAAAPSSIATPGDGACDDSVCCSRAHHDGSMHSSVAAVAVGCRQLGGCRRALLASLFGR